MNGIYIYSKIKGGNAVKIIPLEQGTLDMLSDEKSLLYVNTERNGQQKKHKCIVGTWLRRLRETLRLWALSLQRVGLVCIT